ncbi:hypothetical protein CHELA1G11_11995 [Hyphomicrobiales bacterium]|nr:hypothetical protein CHELA1G11_11995 [Hyphomicrobiales bacterium]CAH1664024.1 conserved hypothetical protein [Hyphomicrobiales bacterium]
MSEVTEFLVALPERMASIPEINDRMKEHLEKRYPHFTFKVTRSNPYGPDLLVIAPVLGGVGDKGSRLLPHPPAGLIAEIQRHAEAFNSAATAN